MTPRNLRQQFFVTDHTREVARNWGVGDYKPKLAIMTLAYFLDKKLEFNEHGMYFTSNGLSYGVVFCSSQARRLYFTDLVIPPNDRLIFVRGNKYNFQVLGIYDRSQVRFKRIPKGYELIPEDLPMTEETLPLIAYIEAETVGMLQNIASAKLIPQSSVISIETYINSDDADVYRLWYWNSRKRISPNLSGGGLPPALIS